MEICQDCGKTFSTKKLFHVHKINHNESEVKCETCGIICIVKKKFLNHLKYTNTLIVLTVKNQLTHQRICKGILSLHKCKFCDYENKTSCRLRALEEKHHEDPKVKG